MEKETIERSFLASALTTQNKFQTTSEFLDWFESRKNANTFTVEKIPFSEFDNWHFEQDSGDLVHKSGKFFKIRGLRSTTQKYSWDQPIIDQAEVGILGIISKVVDGTRYFLMQAKMEPGNLNTLQLSPTVQATWSNYTQVHEGKKTKYVEYFIDSSRATVLVDQLQTEHGGRFWRKKNRNMIVDVTEDIEVGDDYRWLTLGELKSLMEKDDFVNMDSRSVISCIPYIDPALEQIYATKGKEGLLTHDLVSQIPPGFSQDVFVSLIERTGKHSMNEIISWFTGIKTATTLQSEDIGLKNVTSWTKTENEIKHETQKFFSVIAVNVQAGNREVQTWTQPMIEHYSDGFSGFITKKINGVLHFLVQACLEPGSAYIFEIIPTVLCYNKEIKQQENKAPPYVDYFDNATEDQTKFNCFWSAEGGRFYQSHYNCKIIEIDQDIDLKPNYIWVTLGQLNELSKHNYLSLDARELHAWTNFMR